MGVPLRVVSWNVHGLRGDLGALAGVVRDAAPDVLVLQEGPRRWRWRIRCAQLAKALDLSYGGGGLPALGNVLLTNLRVHVREVSYLRFPLTPGRHLRGAFLARCEIGRTECLIAGTHLSVDAGERPAQARRLKTALGGGCAIVAADVNETADGEAWGILAGGLVDSGGGPTFPAADPRRRLDAILVDPRATVTRYEVLDGPAVARASDHRPVLVELTLPA